MKKYKNACDEQIKMWNTTIEKSKKYKNNIGKYFKRVAKSLDLKIFS